jgi:DNA-binding beta-propeller fold protein YncE
MAMHFARFSGVSLTVAGFLCGIAILLSPLPAPAAVQSRIFPMDIVASPDGKLLYLAGHKDLSVHVFDCAAGKIVRAIPVLQAPTGLALSKDGGRLFVACEGPVSRVCIIDTAANKIIQELPAGHTAMSVVLSPDETKIYVCNRFDNQVEVFDLPANKQSTIAVPREPMAAAITPDGKILLVANHLTDTAATASHVAGVVSIVDTASLKVTKNLRLPNGSNLLNDVTVSPDGKYAAVTHNVARFHMPTTQLDRGWMNTSAISLIDIAKLETVNTVLLDNIDRGAAYPWSVVWTKDGKQLAITHAGTHELSVIDAPGLLAKLAQMPDELKPGATADYSSASRVKSDVPNDLAFLRDLRSRLKLSGNGPRSLEIVGGHAWIAHYFSGTLERLNLAENTRGTEEFSLTQGVELTKEQRGEMLFNDANICFQGWQSCASCHSYDARVDGLNWDLLNDGIGNPKNSKSLLLSFETPPAMSMGIRETAETAVRSGIRHILFTEQPPEVAAAIDAYIQTLEPIPSPRLVKGELSEKARRGKAIFDDPKAGCATCHPPAKVFTDQHSHDVGTKGMLDQEANRFDTPTLIEAWRTAPYFHDGSAATIREVLKERNAEDRHGKTSHLNDEEIEALTAYVLSL